VLRSPERLLLMRSDTE